MNKVVRVTFPNGNNYDYYYPNKLKIFRKGSIILCVSMKI